MPDPLSSCPACGGAALVPLLRIEDVPVAISDLHRSASEARDLQRGTLDLAHCPACGLVRNAGFDAALMPYTTDYENSQLFSGRFRAFATELAAELIDRHDAAGGTVVEIGSGKGEFLSLLLDLGVGSAVGFDPTYDGEVDGTGGPTIVRDTYQNRHLSVPADLIVCRHVLEHLEDPYDLLVELRAEIGDRSAPVYFEVPDARFVLSADGMWDLIYQHVSYFSAPSLRRLFERAGFDVVRIDRRFDDQFVSVEARPRPPATSASTSTPASPPDDELGDLRERIAGFPALFTATLSSWNERIRAHAGGAVVLWGAGSKGVSLLNWSDVGEVVTAAVDVNERKHGSYVAGTGQRIIAPHELPALAPALVIVANRAYEAEITEDLARLGLSPEVVCV